MNDKEATIGYDRCVVPYAFLFEHEDHAKRFVERCAHYLKDVAIYRDGADVQVWDGSERGQREEIYRLARMSSAAFSIKIEIP